MAMARYMIRSAADGRTFASVEAVPASKVGLVLGCSRILPNGRRNLFFKYRIEAAAELFHHEKVQYLLVSGDNHDKHYDEPSDMKAALIELGVPADRIICDYAGFSTLDSIVRANAVFLEDRVTVISQPFHNDRAIFIGAHRGLDVIGYNARDLRGHHGLRTRAREALARVKTVLDVFILNRQPRFFGEPIPIGLH
jgi:SanA protein